MKVKLVNFFKRYLSVIVVALLCGIFIFNFATATVNGSSMFPNYKDGDLLLIKKTHKVAYGDVVVVWSSQLKKQLCKRVIGKAGDTIKISDGVIYRNGEPINEPYLNIAWTETTDEIVVEENSIYVLGDNRTASTDSRELGCFSVSSLYGKELFNITANLGVNYKKMILIIALSWGGFALFIFILSLKSRKKSDS